MKDCLLMIVACGAEDIHRSTLAFATALTAASSDIEVTIFLAMRGTIWASRSASQVEAVPGFDSIYNYIDLILEAGGRVMVCSTCTSNRCPIPVGEDEVRPGIAIAGLPQVAARMGQVSTVVF